MTTLKVVSYTQDWKAWSEDAREELKSVLSQFGLSVIDNPMTEGSDAIGVLISNRPLTEDELDQYVEEEEG